MTLNTQHQEYWEAVKSTLKSDVGETSYSNLIAPLAFNSFNDGLVTLEAPSRYICDRVQRNFGIKIREVWRELDPDVRRVMYKVGDSAAHIDALDDETDPHEEEVAELRARGEGESTPAIVGDFDDITRLDLDERFTFDKFVVGRPNEFAFSAAKRLAEDPHAPYNPLFLHGNSGLGKTHLLTAIARRRKELFPHHKVIMISAETFLVEFLEALRERKTGAFKEILRAADLLIVDDVQEIFGKTHTQEEFFHTFNALIERKRQIVMSAERSPTELDGLTARLRSRLGWGLVADLHPTDYELRRSILDAKVEAGLAATPGVKIDPKVLNFLAHRILSDVRTLEGALNRLFAIASMTGRPISIEMAQRELQSLLRHSDRKVSVDEIQRKVSDHFNIRMSDMYSARRARAVARPRQVAMYLCKELTQKSLPDIGKKFGNRDHTTVMHAIKRIKQLREVDSAFDDDIERLRRALEA